MHPPQRLGGVDQLLGPREARLAGAKQGLVGHQTLLRPAHDGLEGQLETGERAGEALREAGVLRVLLLLQVLLRLALDGRELVEADGALDHLDELLRIDRLEQVPEGAELDRLHRGRELRRPGDEDDGHFQAALAHGPQDFHAVHPGQRQIGDDGVERQPLEQRKRVPAVRRGIHGEARAVQDLGEDPAKLRIVVDYQHSTVVSWASLQHVLPASQDACSHRHPARGRRPLGCLEWGSAGAPRRWILTILEPGARVE